MSTATDEGIDLGERREASALQLVLLCERAIGHWLELMRQAEEKRENGWVLEDPEPLEAARDVVLAFFKNEEIQ